MRWVDVWRERLRTLFFRARQDREMGEELRFHLENETELLVRDGLDRREARRQARLRFGGIEGCKEEVRRARGLSLLENIAKDLRFAVRNLARRPGFALGVALTLGLGIGATTTIYAVVDGVILRPLPYEEPSALVTIGLVPETNAWLAPGVPNVTETPQGFYTYLRERALSFESLAAFDMSRVMPVATGDGGEERVPAIDVSSEFFEMLGAATPALGRAFLAEEYRGVQGPVMITYGEWQRRYGGDPGILGRTIGSLRGGLFPATVVGVLPADFRPMEAFIAGRAPGYYFPGTADDPASAYVPPGPRRLVIVLSSGERLPTVLTEEEARQVDRARGMSVIGRLRPGVSFEQARSELERLYSDFVSEAAVEYRQSTNVREFFNLGQLSRYPIGMNALQAQTVGASGGVFELFSGAAGLLLILAAMNAATLLLARSLDRSREFGVRMALGAGRMRIVRLLMNEAGILALIGGAFGVALAYGGVGAFLRYAPSSIPRLGEVVVDSRVMAVAVLVSIGTGIAVGLLPALRLTPSGPWQRLQRGGSAFAEPNSRLRTVLVGGQIAVAVILLASAGLLFNSFVRIRALDPGFEPDGLITTLELSKGGEFGAGLPQWQAWDLVLDEMRAVPGVESAAGASGLPFQRPPTTNSVRLRGDTPETSRGPIAQYAITPDYLETMGIRLLAGRSFERLDGPDTQRVALVNESFVRTQLGGADAIDSVFQSGEAQIRIVGVVEDVIQTRAEEGFRPAIYFPHTQSSQTLAISVVLRTSLPTEAIVPALTAVSARITPVRQPFVTTMRDRMATTRTDPRFQTILIGAFALVATLLAAAGLYASMVHFVGRRRRELGVRMALGAGRAGVLRMVFGQGMRVTMASLAAGMIATLLSARVLAGFLYGVEPNDPSTLLVVGAVFVVVSGAACLVPARRATAVDPVAVLREE